MLQCDPGVKGRDDAEPLFTSIINGWLVPWIPLDPTSVLLEEDGQSDSEETTTTTSGDFQAAAASL